MVNLHGKIQKDMNEEQIRKRLKIVQDLNSELNSLKATYQDMLDEDSEYQEYYEKEQEFKKERVDERDKVLGKSVYMVLKDEMKDLRRDISENKEALAMELIELYREKGTLEVTDHEGNVKTMKFTVRLVG